MNENDVNVKFIELRCPVCGQLLLRIAGVGCIIEIKCWRNDCSKPLLRYPTPQFEIVRRELNSATAQISKSMAT